MPEGRAADIFKSMQIRLSLWNRNGRLIYGIPLWYRLFSGITALILIAAAIFSGGLGTAGTVILGIVVLASFYEERWVFDTKAGTCTGRIGLVFAARKTSFAASDVSLVRIDIFAKGRLDQHDLPPTDKMPRGSQARLIVELHDGQRFMLDSVALKNSGDMEMNARAIAQALGAPIEL